MLNNFIYAKTKDLFLAQLNAGNILDEAIVFIEDTKEIWNHGTYFAQKEETNSSSLIFDTDTIALSDYSSEYDTDMFFNYTLDEEACIACCGKTISDFQNCVNNTNVYLKWKGITVPINATMEGMLIFTSITMYNSNPFNSPHRSILFMFGEENGSQKIYIVDQVWVEEIGGFETVLNITNSNGIDVLYSYANTQTDVTAALLSNMNSASAGDLRAYLSQVIKPIVLKIGDFYIPMSYKNTEEGNLVLMFSTIGQGFKLTIDRTSIILHGDYSFGYAATNTSGNGDIENVTYSQLIKLKNNSNLVKGKQYRIIDYVTTIITENTQSANHSFDLIVVADDTNILNEKARAIQHEGDTYFNGQHLEAWQVWYCIDNDINRFVWADETNGKGVIYRMIDEKHNDCPYDFKNIMFTHPSDTTTYPDYYFTFTNLVDSVVTDKSLTECCFKNTIKEAMIDTPMLHPNWNIFLSTSEFEIVSFNMLNNNCLMNFFYGSVISNSLDSGCIKNILRSSAQNTFGKDCTVNNIAGNRNVFGNNCSNNTLNSTCSDNVFGNDCNYNTLDANSNFNVFQSNCDYNTLGRISQHNFFGLNCSYNSFRRSADVNGSIRWMCHYNYFAPGCKYNVIWNNNANTTNLQNIKVHAGVSGTSSAYNIINITTHTAKYEINVAKNSAGEIKIYCDADLVQ